MDVSVLGTAQFTHNLIQARLKAPTSSHQGNVNKHQRRRPSRFLKQCRKQVGLNSLLEIIYIAKTLQDLINTPGTLVLIQFVPSQHVSHGELILLSDRRFYSRGRCSLGINKVEVRKACSTLREVHGTEPTGQPAGERVEGWFWSFPCNLPSFR